MKAKPVQLGDRVFSLLQSGQFCLCQNLGALLIQSFKFLENAQLFLLGNSTELTNCPR